MVRKTEINFTKYLKQEFEQRLSFNARYSLRAFARDLDVPVSRISELLSGKSGISLERAKNISSRLKLSASEARFVEDLAVIEFGKVLSLKEKAQERRNAEKAVTPAAQITAKDFGEISDWYYFAILEVISKVNIPCDFKILSQRVWLSLSLCQFAMDRLIRKGLINEQDGYWKASNKSLMVVGEAKESIQKFHTQFAAESVKAFNNSKFEEREFCSSFLMLSQDEVQVIRKKIQNLAANRFNALQIPESDKTVIEEKKLTLYGLGIQLFPVRHKTNQLPKINTKIIKRKEYEKN